tara:strand:+ start:1745 stop:2296 length:552 start_codon:yes stop_codon:yes gene_type:complete
MAVPVSELQKSNPSAIIELFILQLSTAIHGTNTIHRFHAGTNQNGNGEIVYGGVTYVALPVQSEGFGYNVKTSPRPTLRIANVGGNITTILATLSMGLEGASLTRRSTLLRYLDATNFSGGSSPHSPDTTAYWDERFVVDRKAIENREIVEYELRASYDLQSIKVPRRQVLPNDYPGIGSFVA